MTLAAATTAAQLVNAAPDDVEITDSSAATQAHRGRLPRRWSVGARRSGDGATADPADPAGPAGKNHRGSRMAQSAAAWSAWSPVVPSNCGPYADDVLAAIRCHDAIRRCHGRRLPMPGWVWSSWVQTRCAVAGAGQSGHTLSAVGGFRRQP